MPTTAGPRQPAQPAAAGRVRGPRRGQVGRGGPSRWPAPLLVIAVLVGVAVGPAGLSLPQVLEALATQLPWHPHVAVPALDTAIVWQIRLPRVMLGALVGSMLAGGGAAYQGVFRNPLADPYLLGVAAGAGLGATIVVVSGASLALTAAGRVRGRGRRGPLTYLLGAGARPRRRASAARSGTGSILLAGVAVAALLTAFQTYLQQEHTQTLADGLLLDPRRPVRGDLVGCLADPAVRRRVRDRAADPPAAARRAAGRRDRGDQPRRERGPAAAHGGDCGHPRASRRRSRSAG